MDVIGYPTARAFLADAEPFLLRAEVENSLILGIARELLGDASGLPIAPYFATVRDDAGICVAAFQTLRTKLGLTQSRRADALPLLAADVHSVSPTLRAVLGPEPTAGVFAGYLASLRGARAEPAMSQRIYELRRVEAPGSLPPGELRQAVLADTELLTRWAAGFLNEARDSGNPEALVNDRLRRGQLFVWDRDGPCAMAAWAGKTPNGVRVNFVYTPPALRRRGYASAVVAALSQLLLDQGNEHCCLYTDLANPTSNAIYQRIGYRAVSDAAVYRLDGWPLG